MRYLHTMLRVRDLDAALDFYCNKLGLKETRRRVDDKNRYTLVFLAAPGDEKIVDESKKTGRPGLEVELTYNWDSEDYGEARYFGHLAYEVDDIYATCDRRDGFRAFPRQALDRAAAEGLAQAAAGAVEIDGKYRQVVGAIRLPVAAKAFIPPKSLLAVRRQPTAGQRPSSRGLGHRPFTAVTGVRIP
jgi:lactoylglutathione lyase